MSDSLETQWLRAMRGQDGQQSAIRILAAKATARDLSPTRGSHAILHAAQSGGKVRKTVSLNVRRADGSQGKAFCWGVAAFGWGAGEWPPAPPAPADAVADQGYPEVAAAAVPGAG